MPKRPKPLTNAQLRILNALSAFGDFVYVSLEELERLPGVEEDDVLTIPSLRERRYVEHSPRGTVRVTGGGRVAARLGQK